MFIHFIEQLAMQMYEPTTNLAMFLCNKKVGTNMWQSVAIVCRIVIISIWIKPHLDISCVCQLHVNKNIAFVFTVRYTTKNYWWLHICVCVGWELAADTIDASQSFEIHGNCHSIENDTHYGTRMERVERITKIYLFSEQMCRMKYVYVW